METLQSEIEQLKLLIVTREQEIHKLNGEIHDLKKQTEKDMDLLKRCNSALNEKTIQFNLLDKIHDQLQEKVFEKL